MKQELSPFRLDVSGLGKGKHPLHGCLRYCYQLTPCNPDKALRYCWTLYEDRLESNQGSHMLDRYLSEEM